MNICLTLGYPDDSLEPTLSGQRLVLAGAILDKLDALDSALAQATLDSMAVKVGDLSVDYTAHISALRKEGSRLLKELSRVTGVPISYDRYSERDYSDEAKATNPLNVVSYW